MLDIFYRTALAAELTGRLLDPPPASSIGSGLFLAAPRRTGKSTFLVADLVPALTEAGAHPVYVDLWRDIDRDAAEVIVSSVGAALAAERGAFERVKDALRGIETVSAGNLLSVTIAGSDGRRADVSLTDALLALSDELQAPIVLIIDEAQHAITTDAGQRALFALKAARDALNIGRDHGLRIVATGSNRDKLSMLRGSKDQAFFGAPLISFPPLNENYVAWFIDQRGLGDVLDVAATTSWFERAGHRPEILAAAADSVLYELGGERATVAQRIERAIDAEVLAADEATMRVVRSLTALQSSVLRELACSGPDYAPFEQATMQRYAQTLRRIAPDSELEPSDANVQSALGSLQKRGLIWRAARGVYALEDSRLLELMRTAGMLD